MARVGICNPDPNVTGRPAAPLAQNFADGITYPVRRKLMRVGICNPDPDVMSTVYSPAVAQNVTDGIANPVRRSS